MDTREYYLRANSLRNHPGSEDVPVLLAYLISVFMGFAASFSSSSQAVKVPEPKDILMGAKAIYEEIINSDGIQDNQDEGIDIRTMEDRAEAVKMFQRITGVS